MSVKFCECLKKAREKQGISQKKLAEYLFVSQQTVAKWETDKSTPNPETITKISEILNVSFDYLLGGQIDNNVEPVDLGNSFFRIPVYGTIPAGIPMEAIEDILGYVVAPEDWKLGGKNYFGLKIKGNSMEPEYRNGDIVIFEASQDCENNDDCAVAVNGNDWTFKRVEKTTEGIFLKPLNPNYETKFYSNSQIEKLPVEIKGVFKELRRR